MNNMNQILKLVGESNSSKIKDKVLQVFLKAVLAGMFIGIGGTVAIKVMTRFLPEDGLRNIAGAFVFSIGFVMIITFGAQLFTGNSLMTFSILDKKKKVLAVLKNWTIVWIGNLVGAVLFAALVYYSNGFSAVDIELITNLVSYKVELSFGAAVLLGMGCNIVIVLTVLLGIASNDYLAKVVVSVFGVMVFFLSGYEHVIANMYFLAIGALEATEPVMDLLLNNLLPVTIGNVIGGAIVVPVLFYFANKK